MKGGLVLIYGMALNDSKRPASWTIDGKRYWCPIYATWHHMLERCFCKKWHKKQPSYVGSSCSEDWLLLSNFEKWMMGEDWEGKQLDKDFLSGENKHYSAETCVFIDQRLNKFITDRKSLRGEYPLGVKKHKDGGFVATCWDPFKAINEYLGYYKDPEVAHNAWKDRKHSHALAYADLQTDPRVAEVLRTKYL